MKYKLYQGIKKDWRDNLEFALAAVGLLALIFIIIELAFTGTFTKPLVRGF